MRPGLQSLAFALALGLAVRLPFLFVNARPTGDAAIFRGWARSLEAEGLAAAYQGGEINYPLLSLYLLAGAGWIEARLAPAGSDRLLTALIVLPAIAADLLTAWAIALALPAASAARRAWFACLYLLNPAIGYVSAYWGQIDSIYALFMVVSVIALGRGRVGLAWLAGALALSTKLQSLALAPLLLWATWRQRGLTGLAQGGAVMAGAVAALAAPWLLAGEGAHLLQAVLPHAAPRVTVSGYNLWYLLFLGRVHEVSSLLRPAGLPFTYRQIGIGLYGLFVLFVLIVVRRQRPQATALLAAVLALGLFALLTEVHERFMFPTLALLLLAAGQAHAARPARLGWVYAALSLTFAFNLVTIAPFSPLPAVNLVAAQSDSPGLLALRALALVCAALNIALLAWLTVVLARSPSSSTRPNR